MVGALKMISAAQPGLSEPLGNLEVTLNDAMDNVRKSVHDLHDESINLKEALEKLELMDRTQLAAFYLTRH